jgi:hypothetical protein
MLRIRNSSTLMCPLFSCPSRCGRSEYVFIFIQRSPSNSTSVSRNPGFRDLTSKEPLRGRPIVNYPIPDYSKLRPKVNTNITACSGNENREVSSAVACCVVQTEARNPHGMGCNFWFYLLYVAFVPVWIFYLGNGWNILTSIVRWLSEKRMLSFPRRYSTC